MFPERKRGRTGIFTQSAGASEWQTEHAETLAIRNDDQRSI